MAPVRKFESSSASSNYSASVIIPKVVKRVVAFFEDGEERRHSAKDEGACGFLGGEFQWVDVDRLRRHEKQKRTDCLNGCAYLGVFMQAQFVHHRDIADTKRLGRTLWGSS